MENLWTPLFSLTVFLIVFAVGDVVSYKTKGLISGIIIAAVVYIAGYWTGIIPTDSVASTGMPTMLTAFMIPLLLVNLGTSISISQLLSEWKTVAIALIGLVGLALISFTVSSMLFTIEYALSASSPIAGGTIAAIITNEAAVAAGKPEYGAFAMLVVSFQMFIGMPVSSFMLKKESERLLNNKHLLAIGPSDVMMDTEKKKKFSIHLMGDGPVQYQTTAIICMRVAIIAIIAYFISNLTIIPGSNPTNYYLNPNVAYLLFGIVFGEVGFLVKNGLQKAGLYGFTMLCLYSLTPNSFTSVTPEALLDMVIPLVGTLVFGAIGIAIFSVIAGKFLGYSVYMSIAIGMCALMGYPGTQIVTDDVVNALSASSEEKAAVSNVLLPRMLVGGFTTVSIASVIFAGIITPLIF